MWETCVPTRHLTKTANAVFRGKFFPCFHTALIEVEITVRVHRIPTRLIAMLSNPTHQVPLCPHNFDIFTIHIASGKLTSILFQSLVSLFETNSFSPSTRRPQSYSQWPQLSYPNTFKSPAPCCGVGSRSQRVDLIMS